jgi:hypothetical protein
MGAVGAGRAAPRPGHEPWDDDGLAGVREPRPVAPQSGSAAVELKPPTPR